MTPKIDLAVAALPAPETISETSTETVALLANVQDSVTGNATDLAKHLFDLKGEFNNENLPDLPIDEREKLLNSRRDAARRNSKATLSAKLAPALEVALSKRDEIAAAKAAYAPVSYLQAFGTTAEGLAAFNMLDRLSDRGVKKETETKLAKLAAGDNSVLPWLGAISFVLEKRDGLGTPAALANAVVARIPEYQDIQNAIRDADRAITGIANIARDVAKNGRVSPYTKVVLGLMDRTNRVNSSRKEED